MTRPRADTPLGTDPWSREAERVRVRATRLGLALDEAELALCDVRDLQALRLRADAALMREGHAAPAYCSHSCTRTGDNALQRLELPRLRS
jgi:hypothetical protein